MGTDAVNKKITITDVKKVDSSTFFTALKSAKYKNPYGPYVTLHDVEDYSKCKSLFLLYDNTAGIAIEEDGNIISVFSDQTHRGVLRYLLTAAVNVGGNKLDCFGSERLRALYHQRGFIPICKTKFVRKFAPDDWNYERDGEPDIIFWIYDYRNQTPMNDVCVKVDWENIVSVPSYDQAWEYREQVIKMKHGF